MHAPRPGTDGANPAGMNDPHALPKVVVLGSGFGGLETTFYLRKRLGKRAQITVVSNADKFLFKPNTIYMPFGKPLDELTFELAPVFERRHIRFVKGEAYAIDPGAKTVSTSDGVVPYDQLVVATGAAMRPEEIPGLAEHANTIWSPAEMSRLGGSLRALVERAKAGAKARVVFLVPPNNKCSGPLYELVLMTDTWLRRQGVREQIEMRYATYEAHFIQAFGPRLHEVITGEFTRRGIVGTNLAVVKAVEPGRVVFTNGTSELFDLLVSFPPYVAAQRYDALPSDDRGFLHTDVRTRQVQDFPDVYAVGDTADFPVKQAFLALLQADAVGEHIAERVLGEEPTAAFDPVSMCIMEQFDKATFAQVPLRLTGDPSLPVAVRDEVPEMYRVGSGAIWRMGKKMLGGAIPHRFAAGLPFHAGTTWAVMEAGLKVMTAAFTD
jgi:NADH dehydrogenase FAD-containing subunit